MKRVIDTVIGEPQTGFVPGRVISWNTHLLNLIQAYLDETDETGLFIFLWTARKPSTDAHGPSYGRRPVL